MFDMVIDEWTEKNKDAILRSIARIIAIPSIATQDRRGSFPYGEGCARALDFVLGLAGDFGLETKNYGYYCGSALLPGRGDKKIGLFVHLDTADVSDMWLSDPFEMIVKDDYIIGCGVQDNKGAAISLLYLLKFLKDNHVMLRHTVELVFGCAKKPGMMDIDHYLEATDAPQLSLVADADFPVCVQEKGSADFELNCPFYDDYVLDFRSGHDANAIPDMAFALLKNADYSDVRRKTRNISYCSVIPVDSFIKLSVRTRGGHAAFPVDRMSPIPLLAKTIIDLGLVNQAGPLLELLQKTYCICDGSPFGLFDDLTTSTATTHICSKTGVSKKRFYQTINIRYPSCHNVDEVIHKVETFAKENGFDSRLSSNITPWSADPFPLSLAALLTDIANKYLGCVLSPYTMGGITYAHKLPNSLPFGPNMLRSDFPLNYGIGHVANEAIFIQDLMNLIKIYAVALDSVDEMF